MNFFAYIVSKCNYYFSPLVNILKLSLFSPSENSLTFLPFVRVILVTMVSFSFV